MFHSSHNAQKLQQLRSFLTQISTFIIDTQQTIDPSTIKLKQNFIPAYTLVHDMCTEKPSLQQKMLQQFKHCLVQFIQTYIMQTQQKQQLRFSLQNSSRVIQWFNVLWGKYVKFIMAMAKKVFAYLDRRYMPGTEQQSLYRVALKTFRKNVCHEHNMKFFEDCFMKEVGEVCHFFIYEKIRQKKVIHNTELLKFSDALAIIDCHQLITSLTNRFISQSLTHYRSVYHQSSSLPSVKYYNHIHNLLLFQQVLISMCICMTPFEVHKVFEGFEEILVKQFTGVFCGEGSQEHGLRKMFGEGNVEFMKVVGAVYGRFEGFGRIKEGYYEYLLEEGDKIIEKFKGSTNIQHSLPIVDAIHSFYKSHLTTLTLGFNKRNQLLVTLNNAIQKIISRLQGFTTILYTYCSKSRSQNTFQLNKQKIDLLFDKILSKDQFVALYQNELFRKIASGGVDLEKEEMFVNYLNGICGSEVTHKLVKKIKDVSQIPSNKDLVKGLSNSIDLNVCVLSLPLWQKSFTDQISLNLTMPTALQSLWKSIQKNFIQLQPKKKLIPLPFENKLTLQVNFNKRPILIKCNLIQASIFCFLSSKAYTSEQDIITQLSIQKNVVQSTMQTFESIPHLLLKTTLGDYIVNWYFDQSQPIVDLVSRTQQSNKQMSKAIKQDRQILVQAAIVKFVKRAKKVMFEEVVQGVVKAIRLFKPLPQVIKAAVDKLVKKGFIEEGEGGVLEYVE